MKKIKIMMRATLCTALIFLISCKKENISKPMANERIFYTQEGKPYVLKTVTKYIPAYVVTIPPLVLIPSVSINPLTPDPAGLSLEFNTDKKIIPVSYTLSIRGLSSYCDIASPYYWVVRPQGLTPLIDPIAQRTLSKQVPMVDRVFYTSDNFFNYNIRYNDLIFSDSDFINTQGYMVFYFTASLMQAFTFQDAGITVTSVSETIIYASTFTYFEML